MVTHRDAGRDLVRRGDVAAGELSWTVTSIRLDSFVYNQFHYADLTPRRFTHSAGNQFTMQQP